MYRKLISIFLVLCFVSTALASWNPTTNLVAHWTFDNSADVGHAEVGPNGSSSTRQAWMQPLQVESGIIGAGSAAFNGVSSLAVVPNASLQSAMNSNTVSYAFWTYGKTALGFLTKENFAFQADDGYDAPHVMGDIHGPASGICWLNADDHSQQVQWLFDPTFSSLFADKWAHVTLTDQRFGDNSGVMKIYVNGQLKASLPLAYDVPMLAATPWMAIGSRPWGTGGAFAGKIDDFRIYNSILTSEEMAVLMTPEPATICMLGLGGLALLRKKR